MSFKRTTIFTMALIIFGIVTVAKGGHVLSTESGKIAAGHYIPFILWFNFIAGFFYIAAGIGLLKEKAYGGKLTKTIALSSFLVLVLLIIHILEGQPYELRTLAAMTFRTTVWTLAAIFIIKKKHCQSSLSASEAKGQS